MQIREEVADMEHADANKRKFIPIDLTKGRKIFDTTKMDEWSPDEWTAFVGTEEDHHLKIPLLNTATYGLIISSVFRNEVTKAFTLELEMENKTVTDIRIKAIELNVDEAQFKLLQTPPFYIRAHAKEKGQITVTIPGDYLEFFNRSVSLTLDIMETETGRWLEGYEFDVKVY